MAREDRLATLREEIISEQIQRAEQRREWRRESLTLTRIHSDRWRQTIRQRYLDAWVDDTAHRLGRLRETVRLCSIAETYALEDAQSETYYLQATGQTFHFSREEPIAQKGEIEGLLAKLARRLPDGPIFILRGVASFWKTAHEDEPDEDEVWQNGSRYFGAIEARSAEVLANAGAWLDRRDFENSFISATDTNDMIELDVGRARGLVRHPSYEGLACGMDLFGPQWGQLLGDEPSDSSNHAATLEREVARRARRDVQPS